MKVEYIEESSVRKALAFEVESEIVEKEVEAKARQYSRNVRLPGFRPGKVPPDVVKKRFRGAVMEDVVEAIVNRVVREELDGRGLRPVDTPKVEDLHVGENEPLRFKAVFEVLPIVELPEWRDMPVKARRPAVAEDAVDQEIDRLREEAARYDPVEGRPAREGDHVVLDVEYRNEGGESKKDENVLVEVGSADNHEDLNAALVGMEEGQTKTVPLSYEEGELKGRSVEYTVTLKGVKTKVVPAADDEFAKDLGEFDSLQELRDKIRAGMLAADERRVDREVKEALVDLLVRRASFEVPEALVERHMTARTRTAVEGLAMRGVDPRTAGVDWKEFHDGQREKSLHSAKAAILLDEIARREGVEASEAEVDAEIARMAERMRRPKESVRKAMEKEGEIAGLRARIREEKTLDLLKAGARMETE